MRSDKDTVHLVTDLPTPYRRRTMCSLYADECSTTTDLLQTTCDACKQEYTRVDYGRRGGVMFSDKEGDK